MVATYSSSSTSIVVLLAVALAASFLCSYGAHALTTAQRDAVLKAHNDFRALKGLSALTYNLDAETFAQDYVNTDGCPTGHSGSGTYGENIYRSSGSTTTLVPAVNSWHSEEPYWSCQNNDCQSGEMCGHYTQVMWNNTQSVGCGLRTTCTGTYATMISCNYYPPGNYVGQRPFSLTICPSYPYFKNDKFVLTVTLNTTASPYSAASFKTALKTALKLGDTDRVYIMGTSAAGSGLLDVEFYIVTVGSSSGSTLANSLVTRVQNKDSSLAAAGLYATQASYSTGSSGASLASWVDLLSF